MTVSVFGNIAINAADTANLMPATTITQLQGGPAGLNTGKGWKLSNSQAVCMGGVLCRC